MLQAFVITLREGVEAALIVGIVFAYLNKVGRPELKRTVMQAVAAAVVGSVLAAVALARLPFFNEDFFEGIVMLVAAFFVISMIWFMQRTAKSLKGKIEQKVSTLTANSSRAGLFLFVFLMVFREGVETVLILSAVSLNSSDLMSFFGTLAGVSLAVVFGFMFVKGSVRVNIQRFFRVTSVILYFVAFQLIVSGLHELSEFGILPSSRMEMKIVGPIVSNEVFFFVTILALAGLMVLFEYRKRMSATVLSADANPAERRKAASVVRRDRFWMAAVYTCSFVFIFLVTAQFIYAMSTTALSPAAPVTLTGSQVTVPIAKIQDDSLHRYVVKVGTTDVRFLLYRKSDGKIVSVADACNICGPVGFYKSGNNIICKLCASPVNAQSLGMAGGCNPIPLKSQTEGGFVVIQAKALQALAPIFSKS